MSIADKLATIAENEQKVFNAGRIAEAQNSTFWDRFQNNGNRIDYRYAFINWADEYIRPKYKVVPKTLESLIMTFHKCEKLKKVEAQYVDFSKKPSGTTNNSGYHHTFDHCTELEEIEDIGLVPQHSYYRTFGYCHKLKTIAKIGVDKNTAFTDAFIYCFELQNLNIVGTIGQNGFDLGDSTKLSKDSFISVINALSDATTGLKVTFSVRAKLSAFTVQEWGKLIATKPNWTFSLR